MELVAFLLFPVFFVALWCAVCSVLSLVSGWNRLARRFPVPSNRPTGRRFLFASGMIGAVSFRNALIFHVTEAGLQIAVFPMFRVGHPPLFLPWNVFSPMRTQKTLWLPTFETQIRLGSFDKVDIAVWQRELAEAMHTRISAAQPGSGLGANR